MALIRSEVSSYKVMFFGQDPDREIGATIHCLDGTRIVATLNFYHDLRGKKIPDSEKRGNRPYLNYPLATFPAVIDLLRNESPLFVTFNDISKLGFLATDAEQVGEGEP
jgi:hypothetical protein